MKTDSSDYINAVVFSQREENGLLHFVAYFSQRIALIKCNYKIYDKELLTIICCFKK